MKNTLRIIFALAFSFVMVFSFAACGNDTESSSTKDTTFITAGSNIVITDDNSDAESTDTTTEDYLVKAEIVIKKYGTIKLDLYADEAPKTVENFVKLAKDGFYDGLTFHRIIKDFMMQGGDPLGTGLGGNTDKNGNEINVVGEFAVNGHTNNISHIRGTISMARNGMSYDSASSQFFICHADAPHLDGQYAAFGRVTDGMDVVDDVCESARPTDSNGTIPAGDQPVIETIKIIE